MLDWNVNSLPFFKHPGNAFCTSTVTYSNRNTFSKHLFACLTLTSTFTYCRHPPDNTQSHSVHTDLFSNISHGFPTYTYTCAVLLEVEHCIACSSVWVSESIFDRLPLRLGAASENKRHLRETERKRQHQFKRAVALLSPNYPWHTRKILFLPNMTF